MRKHIDKYAILIMAMIFFSVPAFAQKVSGERRVYYLDATYSMVKPNKIWEKCKENLIAAINNVDDEDTELVVVIFADANSNHPNDITWERWEEKASQVGKEKLIANIKNLRTPSIHSMTNLKKPWQDFYNEIKPDKVNYMFFMTDGEDEIDPNGFFSAIDLWKTRTGSLTYGFYVELVPITGHIAEKTRQHVDNVPERLWRVSTADVNINLIRLENAAAYNARNDSYIDVPIYFSGKNSTVIKGLKFEIDNDQGFKITKTEISEDKARIYIKNDIDIHNYPAESSMIINASLNADNLSFLLTNSLDVKCINKKEKALFFRDNIISGKVSHYDAFSFVKSRTVPFKKEIELEWSQDAVSDPNVFAEFIITDKNGNRLSSSSDIIFSDGSNQENIIRVSPSQDKISLVVTFPEKTKTGKFQGYLKLNNHNLDRINNIILGDSQDASIQWRIRYVNTWNPLARILLILGIILFNSSLSF